MTRTQTKIIELMFLECIETKRMTDKIEIMNFVEKELNVPKPTIRRVKTDLIKKYKDYIKILQGEDWKPHD